MLQKVQKRIGLFKNPKYPNPYTVDIRYTNSLAYCNSRSWGIGDRTMQILIILLVLLGIWHLISLSTSNTHASENSIRTAIRQERLEICQAAYTESGINKQFIHGEIPAVRCATFMSLVYAFESGFGTSRMCRVDGNCFGMKGNGIDTPAGDLVFSSETEGRKYFAKKYFQWHYKKNIRTFVHNWAMGNREPYIHFMNSRYSKMYQELEKQYLF